MSQGVKREWVCGYRLPVLGASTPRATRQIGFRGFARARAERQRVTRLAKLS